MCSPSTCPSTSRSVSECNILLYEEKLSGSLAIDVVCWGRRRTRASRLCDMGFQILGGCGGEQHAEYIDEFLVD